MFRTPKNQTTSSILAFASVVACLTSQSNAGAAWSFGVVGDTQWTCPTDPAGTNPGKVSASVINQIDAQFIARGVKFVLQVGDLSNAGGNMAVRAAAARQLYDAGIGFFPMRGNHDANSAGNVPNFRANFPQTLGLSNTFGTTNFSSPDVGSGDLSGLSYSFDYTAAGGSARFLIIDDWATPNKTITIPGLAGYPYGYSVGEQQDWIDSQLDRVTRNTEHAFVFSHHNLIGEDHFDCLFSGFANSNIDMQNAFFGSLYDNDVRYYISGHEHLAQRSIVASPDGTTRLQDIIAAPAGPKFINPRDPASPNFFGQKARQTPLTQELNNIGFYIYTVDGPNVTVDYYADAVGKFQGDAFWPVAGPESAPGTQVSPTFNFIKKDSWGYSLNGKEFLVGQGETYSGIVDEFEGTSARILSGSNGATDVDFFNRRFSKMVTTGWSCDNLGDLRSKILTLRGMAGFGTDESDVFVLQLSYHQGHTQQLGKGSFGIGKRDVTGEWLNAVDGNFGGTKEFVMGEWKPEYGLGTYGVDPSRKTAWAVLNNNGDFAVANGIEPKKGHR